MALIYNSPGSELCEIDNNGQSKVIGIVKNVRYEMYPNELPHMSMDVVMTDKRTPFLPEVNEEITRIPETPETPRTPEPIKVTNPLYGIQLEEEI